MLGAAHGDVAADARAQQQRVQRRAVAAQRRLGPAAAGHVVPQLGGKGRAGGVGELVGGGECAHRAAMVGGDKVRRVDRDDLAFAGLSRHADLIAAGELCSRELTELFLARIARLDPRLNAFRVVFSEQALIEADQADGRRRGGDARPLLGVPIAIKDDIHVAGEITGYGCDWDPPVQPADSEVVRRLRAAGAVIIGKTHVPELMATGFTESPTYGVTRNPWDLHRTSGGSSGGSATAVAAGLVSAALGIRRRRLDPDPRGVLSPVRLQAAARARLDRPGRRSRSRDGRLRPARPHGRGLRPAHGRPARRRSVLQRGRRAPTPGSCGSRSPSGCRRWA